MYFSRLQICNLCTLWHGPFNENPCAKLRLGRSKVVAFGAAVCFGQKSEVTILASGGFEGGALIQHARSRVLQVQAMYAKQVLTKNTN